MTQTDRGAAGDRRYQHVLQFVAETPWAIQEEALATIVAIVEYRSAGQRLSDEEIRARIDAASGGGSRQGAFTRGGVAVLPLYGAIIPRADMFTEMSGATSVQRFSALLRQALDDEEIDAILIDVDSPGGSVAMITELAAEIRSARGRKPITAIANTKAASAAYWLAAQADEIVVTPSGEVGSIGVYSAHTDFSRALELAGITTTLISYGEHKTELSPYKPLSPEAIAALQTRVDVAGEKFVADVAAGRGVTADTVREKFGQGRMVGADRALELGMVDRVEPFKETLARVARRNAPSGRGARAGADEQPTPEAATADPTGITFSDEVERALTHVSGLASRAQALADLRRSSGRAMSAANRERLGGLAAELREAITSIDELLAANDPQTEALLREAATFERLKFERHRSTT